MGVPFVNCQIHGSDQQAFIDTGAKLSYIKEELSNGLLPIGNETDFYPGLGEFETQVYEVPFRLGVVEIQMRCGILPKLLETTLLVTGKSAIIGSELYQKQIVCLAFPEKSLLIGK